MRQTLRLPLRLKLPRLTRFAEIRHPTKSPIQCELRVGADRALRAERVAWLGFARAPRRCLAFPTAPRLSALVSPLPPKIAYITAGAAGMYCGSCLHDNTLAAALSRMGVDIQLIPTYTPILTDEQDVSIDRVFFGGINVFLEQKAPLFRFLPRWMTGFLDRPGVIRWATSRGIKTDAKKLGGMTVSMLRGMKGRQRREVVRLVDYLEREFRPDIVNLTNVLIAGCAPEIKRRLGIPVLVTLQGDDVFLDQLPPRDKQRAIAAIGELVEHIDAFLVYSDYYARHMEEYLGIPPEKLLRAPLGLNLRDFQSAHGAGEEPSPGQSTDERNPADRPPAIGYLARLAPEKGLHLLVDAFMLLRQMPGMQQARLEIAGWLGADHDDYARRQFERLDQAGLQEDYRYHGTVSRAGKLAFLRSIDVLSTPTVYREPKGLFVLEALAAGVPVVQPEHGAFPELLAATGGGWLFPPGDAAALAETLCELLADRTACQALGEEGRRNVHARFGDETMARETLAIYQGFTGRRC